ncbi:MAG: restriction endonuclease subunit S [Planctomycetota bacterium]|nr:restriction endonuclease subunit S [Planctomycetota bacterium]
MRWPTVAFQEVFRDATGGNPKTQQKDYLEAGEIPIVDQGQGLIGGFTNDHEAFCKCSPPVIVFGDHTRTVKYVDFPFAIGADGTKILVPRIDADVRYLFYALRSLRLPEAGYSRHFKFLKESTLPLPPLPEQKRIAAILDAADALRAKRRESIEQLDSLVQATFLEMFGDPVTNPKGWSLEPIERIIQKDRPITYGILKPGPEVDGGVPYIRVVDIKEGRVLVDQLKCTSKEIALQYKRSTIAVGDLLMSIRGHVGRMAIAPESVVGANITQDTARLALDAIPPQYVMQCLSLPSMQHYMSKRTKGMAVRGINLSDVKILPIPLPPLALQTRFASIVESIEHQKAQLKAHLVELDALFSSLQSRAFNGELVA